MARLGKEDYIEIYKKYNVNKTWSFSKVETYLQDKYEYYLKYVAKIKGDRDDSAYGSYGTLVHDTIEAFYNKQITKEEVLQQYDNKSTELEMFGRKFDRTDEQKNEKIKLDYDVCVRHYLERIERPNNKFVTELPVILDLTPKIILVGYIDLLEYVENDLVITDFKTSTIFSNADMKDKTAQLMLYAEAIRKRSNLENFEHIKIQYDFIKYVQVKYLQLNGKEKVRNIKRSELGTSLSSAVKTFLVKEGISQNEIEKYLTQLEYTNSIDCLPKNIQDKFSIDKCIVSVDLSEDIIKEFKTNLINTITEIQENENKYQLTLDEKIFWSEVDTKKSFYFANLSEYSMDLHKPYKEYLVKSGLLVDTLMKQEQDKLNEIKTTSQVIDNKSSLDDKWKDMFGD